MLDDTLRRLCRIPAAFREGTTSFAELVDRSGFAEHAAEITVESLATALRADAKNIDLWLSWSENKRSSGPFIRRSGSQFEVGTIGSDGNSGKSEFFSEAAEACATFILGELIS